MFSSGFDHSPFKLAVTRLLYNIKYFLKTIVVPAEKAHFTGFFPIFRKKVSFNN